MEKIRHVGVIGLVAAFLAAAAPASWSQDRAQQKDQVQERERVRASQREIIPGSELMTPAERDDYRRRYAAAKTDEARAKVRRDHVAEMEKRARMRGLQLAPDLGAKGGAR